MRSRRRTGAVAQAQSHLDKERPRDVLLIVGSIGFVHENGAALARALIRAELTERRPDAVVSGDDDGVNTIAAETAAELKVSFTSFRPRQRRWDGPDGLLARNIETSNRCTRALRICCAASRTHSSSGIVARVRKVREGPVREVLISRRGTVTSDSGWAARPSPATAAVDGLPIARTGANASRPEDVR